VRHYVGIQQLKLFHISAQQTEVPPNASGLFCLRRQNGKRQIVFWESQFYRGLSEDLEQVWEGLDGERQAMTLKYCVMIRRSCSF